MGRPQDPEGSTIISVVGPKQIKVQIKYKGEWHYLGTFKDQKEIDAAIDRLTSSAPIHKKFLPRPKFKKTLSIINQETDKLEQQDVYLAEEVEALLVDIEKKINKFNTLPMGDRIEKWTLK